MPFGRDGSGRASGASLMIEAGVKPRSNAPEYRYGLKLEPGWRAAITARLNLLRTKLKPPTSAWIEPSSGSIEVSAACAAGICASCHSPLSSRASRMMSPRLSTLSTLVGVAPTRSSLMCGRAQLTPARSRIALSWLDR